MSSNVNFNIAVFAANEAENIGNCVRSIDRSCYGYTAHIDVLLNGTTDNSTQILENIFPNNASMTVYLFNSADKSNVINHFLYSIRRPADLYFGIDGYVQISTKALGAMLEALTQRPHAHAASGIQLTGRSAKNQATQVLRGGALTGQLFAIRPEFTDRLVAQRLRLPVQSYRGDGLLGSMAAHDLDAMGTIWDNGRIIGVAEAGFAITPLSPFRPQDIQRQFRREIRQARGKMENEAIKSIIYTSGYSALPGNANAMLRTWLSNNRPITNSARDAFFTKLALRQLVQSIDIEPVSPALLFTYPPS